MSSAQIALNEVYQQRLSQSVEFRYKITNYGSDNLYPQKVKEIVRRSPITNSATNAYAKFLRGDGFEDNGDLIINDLGQTLDDILAESTMDDSYYQGWCIHVNTNILGGITDMRVVPFDFIRFGLPDSNGVYKDVKVSINWEGNRQKTIARGLEEIKTYPLWGVDSDDVIDPDEGYMIYVVPFQNVYPRAVADPVLDSAQTDCEIQVFELGNIQNGFLGTSLFRHPGKITDPEERMKIMRMLKGLKGSTGANGIGYLEAPSNFTGPLIENLPANNQDALFEKTGKNIESRILLNYGMPPSIVGLQPDSGMFNQQQLEDSYVYYNLMTRDERNRIVRVFNAIMANWHTGAIDIGGIKENSFITNNSNTDSDG